MRSVWETGPTAVRLGNGPYSYIFLYRESDYFIHLNLTINSGKQINGIF